MLTAICPMTYTPDNRLFQQQVEAARERAGPGQPLWAGIARLPARRRRASSRRWRSRGSAGRAGVVLFSHESLAPGDLRPLRDGGVRRRLVVAPGGVGRWRAAGSR